MAYWTILFITILDPRLEGATMQIIYPSDVECNAARSIVSDTLPYDHSMDCIVSTVISKSVRPLRRPTP